MRDEDLDRIEAALDVRLPAEYRDTMRAYPFSSDSSAAELWLPPDPEWVIQTNREWSKFGLYDRPWSSRYLALGADGGEESYFLDLGTTPASVLVADVELGTMKPLAPDWASWLAMLREGDPEIVEDKRQEEERRRKKKWWQVWIQ